MFVSTPTVVPCRVVPGRLLGVSVSSRSPTPAVPGSAELTAAPVGTDLPDAAGMPAGRPPWPVHAPNPTNPTIVITRIIIILY